MTKDENKTKQLVGKRLAGGWGEHLGGETSCYQANI